MAEFENINSPQSGLSLEKEIQLAVHQAVEPLFRTGTWRLYTGSHQEQLVSSLCDLLGTTHAGLTSSGSAALEMLLRACRLQNTDEVLLSAYDYPGNFTAIESTGARPALVDVEPNGWNLSFDSLEQTWAPSCKVLIVSHLHGQMQDMQRLGAWCRERNLVLIQDACQALGASINGQPLGAWGDATIVSFGGSKVVSAGRGGAWCTRDDGLAQRTRIASGAGSGAFEMSEVQAAMITAQLPFLDRITSSTRAFFGGLLKQWTQQNVIAPWSSQLESTAFYQAGWLMPNGLDGFHSDFKGGFDGFHRRSAKRCRRVGGLENAVSVVERTCVLHHRLALTENCLT